MPYASTSASSRSSRLPLGKRCQAPSRAALQLVRTVSGEDEGVEGYSVATGATTAVA